MTTWQAVEDAVMALPRHKPLKVMSDQVPPPAREGFYASTGLNRAAEAHYRRRVCAGFRGVHVLVFDDHYLVHWDRFDPSFSVLLHFLDDVSWACLRALRRGLARLRGAASHMDLVPVAFVA